MILTMRAVIIGILYVPIIAGGYWLSNMGAPYNQIVFNVHKLLALANIVILNVTLFQTLKTSPPGGPGIAAAVFMNFFFVATIVTGGLVSQAAEMPSIIRWAHRIGPWATVISSGLLLYLLGR